MHWLSHHLERRSFEILRFGNHRNDGVIRGLRIDGDATEDAAGVKRGRENGILKQATVHVVRAAEGSQCAASFYELEGAEMDLLIPPKRVR